MITKVHLSDKTEVNLTLQLSAQYYHNIDLKARIQGIEFWKEENEALKRDLIIGMSFQAFLRFHQFYYYDYDFSNLAKEKFWRIAEKIGVYEAVLKIEQIHTS